jgi:putative membrane protein
VTDPTEAEVPISTPVATTASGLADGEWHRLHPATPLLRGGIALIAILGIIIANLRERLLEIVFGGPDYEGDPIDFLVEQRLIPMALLAIAVALVLFVAGFWLSWRMHTFRITDDLVEVRSGILFRTHRRGRLDRIQGINIVRPLFARIFGAARLEINVAGNDANVKLDYLSSANADSLRRDILRLASGTREERVVATAGASAPGAAGAAGLVERRVAELTAPELDPSLAEPASVVTMHPGRLLASTVLSSGFLFFVLLLVGGIIAAAVSREFLAFFGIVPALLGIGSFLVNRVIKSLRYSIAGTPDGVRVGFGLFSTSNETLPPGRIHSVLVRQSLFWRPFDWWEVLVNRAASSSVQGAAGQKNTTILPVGSRAETLRVLELLLPDLVGDETRVLIENGLGKAHAGDGFTNSPRRAAPTNWFSWRRNGFVLRPDAVTLRRGSVWRTLVLVPTARMQSVSLHQGPYGHAVRLASVQVHTVAGPISARLDALDEQDAAAFFRDVASTAVAAAQSDRSHRWRSGEAPA